MSEETTNNTENTESRSESSEGSSDRGQNRRGEGSRGEGSRGEGSRGEGSRRGGRRDDKRRFFRKRYCYFCKNKIEFVDYKDSDLLSRFVKDGGKILPKRLSGTCAKHQRLVSAAVKKARTIALLPFKTRID